MCVNVYARGSQQCHPAGTVMVNLDCHFGWTGINVPLRACLFRKLSEESGSSFYPERRASGGMVPERGMDSMRGAG